MKHLYSIITVLIFAVGFAASEDSEEEAKKISNLCGTFVITDERNVTYTIKVNDDMTVIAEGNGKSYYGSWYEISDNVRFNFSGEFDELPSILFKVRDLKISNSYQIADDGFIYGDADGFGNPRNHNPAYRLKYRKIN